MHSQHTQKKNGRPIRCQFQDQCAIDKQYDSATNFSCTTALSSLDQLCTVSVAPDSALRITLPAGFTIGQMYLAARGTKLEKVAAQRLAVIEYGMTCQVFDGTRILNSIPRVSDNQNSILRDGI